MICRKATDHVGEGFSIGTALGGLNVPHITSKGGRTTQLFLKLEMVQPSQLSLVTQMPRPSSWPTVCRWSFMTPSKFYTASLAQVFLAENFGTVKLIQRSSPIKQSYQDPKPYTNKLG